MEVTGAGGVGNPRFITGNKDTEPDMFYFSVNGYSGKFLIDKYHRVQLIPEEDIKIILDTTVSVFTKWIIVPPDGTQHIFQDVTDHNKMFQDSPLLTRLWCRAPGTLLKLSRQL